ncbi:MAG: hypothetical protein K5647_10550 [Clostridiales bacterium]|nr:hypothetical protein [Clostridiales bacterium]
MKLLLNYTVKLGKYDGNEDVFEREVETSDGELEKAVERALMTGTYLEDVPELQVLLDQAYKEIEEEQIQKLREEGDDAFALECFEKGKSPFDCGYRIDVFFPDEEFVPDDDRIEAWLKDALASGDVELAEEIVLEHNGNYSGDLLGRSFELAEEAGCREFIDKNKRDS